MDLNSILISGATLGAMGLVFGAGLAYASQKFAVETDPRAVAIREALPGANCGGCGFPGCDQFAKSIVEGTAPLNGCPVGGKDCVAAISEIMGVVVDTSGRKVARVICNGDNEKCQTKFLYEGIRDCKAAMLVGGDKLCGFGCMGYGTCEALCPFDAIHVNEKGMAVVDSDRCTACGICIKACPKKVITLVPADFNVIVDCNNKERGAHVKKNCSVACIACGICQKNCPHDAIHVVDQLAIIDYTKCTQCRICVEKCPTKAISG